MSDVNWCYLPAEELEETAKKRAPVSDAFRAMVFAISGKARVKMLDHEEENTLVRTYQDTGCKSAAERLVTVFDPMILGMAKKLSTGHKIPHLMDDLYQLGQETFLRAIKRYRIEEGNRLSTFVRFSLTGEMSRFCLDHRLPMRTTTSLGEKRAYYRYRAALDEFRAENGRPMNDSPADLARICASLGATPKAFKRARTTHTARIVPIDHVQVWTDAGTHEDIAAVRRLLDTEFAGLDRVMTPRDAAIVRSFLALKGEKNAAQSVAETFDLTPERIRQIAREGMRQIRASLVAKGFSSTADVMTAG